MPWIRSLIPEVSQLFKGWLNLSAYLNIQRISLDLRGVPPLQGLVEGCGPAFPPEHAQHVVHFRGVPTVEGLTEPLGIPEHVEHYGDARGVPIVQMLVERFGVPEHAPHLDDIRGVP